VTGRVGVQLCGPRQTTEWLLGAVRGKTVMSLKEITPGETEFLVETDVSILGKIGEFGQPIIRKKADAMLKEFVLRHVVD